MATTVTGKLNKHASIFQAGESTGFGIRLGVKYYDRESKTEQWCNYEAAVFAKTASQIQFYQQALVEGAIVEVSGDKQRIKQFQGQNGLNLSIEILDARLGAVFSPQAGNGQAGAPQSNRTPAYNTAPAQQPAQTGGAYNQQPAYNQGQHRPGAPMNPAIDFEDDIPFAPIGLQCKRLLHCI